MKHFYLILFVSLTAFFFSACATRQANIPENLSAAELIQRAQEALDRNRFGVALQHYQALLDRNIGRDDIVSRGLVAEAEYGIAHIHFRQGNFVLARDKFNALLERYAAPGGEDLPPQFEVLARRVLQLIDEREENRRNQRRRR